MIINKKQKDDPREEKQARNETVLLILTNNLKDANPVRNETVLLILNSK